MFNDSDWVSAFLFVLKNNIYVVRNDRLKKFFQGYLWFVPIVFHEILEFSFIEIEIDAHQVISPVFGCDSLFSSWKLFEDEYRIEQLMKEEDFLDALDHILARTDGSEVVDELISQLLLVSHGNEFEVVF